MSTTPGICLWLVLFAAGVACAAARRTSHSVAHCKRLGRWVPAVVLDFVDACAYDCKPHQVSIEVLSLDAERKHASGTTVQYTCNADRALGDDAYLVWMHSKRGRLTEPRDGQYARLELVLGAQDAGARVYCALLFFDLCKNTNETRARTPDIKLRPPTSQPKSTLVPETIMSPSVIAGCALGGALTTLYMLALCWLVHAWRRCRDQENGDPRYSPVPVLPTYDARALLAANVRAGTNAAAVTLARSRPPMPLPASHQYSLSSTTSTVYTYPSPRG